MASPFTVFRKNQKTLLVVFGVALMCAFTVGPGAIQFVQSFRGRGENPVAVTWKGGSLRDGDLRNLRIQRADLAKFFQQGFLLAQEKDNEFRPREIPSCMQQGSGDEMLLEHLLLIQEAEKIGMSVSDQAVFAYLDRVFDKVLNRSDFKASLKGTDGRLTQELLFDTLRREIMAEQMRSLALSSLIVNRKIVVPGSGEVPVRFPLATPVSVWRYYQRTTRHLAGQFYPVRAEDYLDKVTETPSDRELIRFFDKHAHAVSRPNSPDPGFKIPRRIEFHYVKADFNKLLAVEKTTIGDKEILEYYEKNKDQMFLVSSEPDIPDFPDGAGPIIDPTGTGTPPPLGTGSEAAGTGTVPPTGTAPSPQGTNPPPPAATNTPPQTTQPNTKPVEPNKPEPNPSKPESKEPAPKKEDPAPTKKDDQVPMKEEEKQPSPKDPSADESSALDASNGLSLVFALDDDPAKEDEKQNPAAAVDDPSKADAPPVPEKTGAPSPVASGDVPPPVATGTPPPQSTETVPPAGTGPALETPKEDAPPEYRPLEDVSDEIRTTLASPKAQDKLNAAFKEVRKRVETHKNELLAYELQKDPTAEPSPPDFSDMGNTFFTYGQTKMIDAVEVSSTELGQSFERSQGRAGIQRIPFPALGYNESVSENSPQESVGENEVRFIYWKTQEQDEYVPEFDEVEAEVLQVWKLQKARELAFEAAQEMAENAEGGSSLKDMFGEEVIEVPDFTYYDSVSVLLVRFGQARAPQLSQIPGVEGVNDEFLKRVFGLEADDVAAIRNASNDITYVVRVVAPTQILNKEAEQQEFMQTLAQARGGAPLPPDLLSVALTDRFQLFGQWYEELQKELDVEWKREPEVFSN